MDTTLLAGKSILIADACADMRTLLTIGLQRAGARVLVADSATMATAVISCIQLDRLVLRLDGSQLNGALLYRRISKHRDWARIPIVLIGEPTSAAPLAEISAAVPRFAPPINLPALVRTLSAIESPALA